MKFFHGENGETLVQIAQGSYECLIASSAQNQIGWVFEQSEVVEGFSARERRFELDGVPGVL